MTRFEDGPAAGQHLMLKRAPFFLLVTHSPKGWDALDQIGDSPRPDETVYAYKLSGVPGSYHINRRGGRGGFYVVANYVFVTLQPSDAEIRDDVSWTEWCDAAAGREGYAAYCDAVDKARQGLKGEVMK